MSSKQVKGYKVTDCKRIKRFGVACGSLKELIERGSKKLCINERNVTVHLQDGTVVDNEGYFKTLPSQTFFILRKPDENIPTGADLIYNALKMVNIDMLRTGNLVQQFFDEQMKEKLQVLSSAVIQKRLQHEKKSKNTLKDVREREIELCNKTKFSTREEDPDWFYGLETNATTKEAFMFKRSKERIRGYFFKTHTDIKKITENDDNTSKMIPIVENIFNTFKCTLTKDEYFGCYFDRSKRGAMCDELGEFACGGLWKEDNCLYKGSMQHVINPYASREERIIFSTWNLDHGIERSRSIIPAIVEASMQAAMTNGSLTVNTPYFYSLLFTSSNLRLVHVVCHDKSKHDTAVCDKKKYLIPLSNVIDKF